MKSPRKQSGEELSDKNTVQTARGRLKGALKDLVVVSEEEQEAAAVSEDETIMDRKLIPARGRPPKRKHEQMDLPQIQQSYIMKLFDRSVDLAKYNEHSPLYPICRDWMLNQPRLNKGHVKKSESPPRREKNDKIAELLMSGEITEITSMPASLDIEITRIPSSLSFQVKKETNEIDLDYDLDYPRIDRDTIMSEHQNRWTNVKKKWIQQSKVCDEKFAPSIKLLNTIYKQ